MANRVSNEQLEALMQFLEEHPSLARSVNVGPRAKGAVDRQWNDLAMKLNSIGSGSSKTGERWKRYWADLKHKSKCRLAKCRQEASGIGGGTSGPSSEGELYDIDKRIIAIIGEPAVYGDIQHRVPIFNYVENVQMETPQEPDNSTSHFFHLLEVSEEIEISDEEIQNAPMILAVSPSTRGQTSRVSVSGAPEMQIPEPTSQTGLESPVSRPLADRTTRRPRHKSSQTTNRQPRIDADWIKDLERRRVEAEATLAKAAMIMADASKIQAEAAKTQAEAAKTQAEASLMREETLREFVQTQRDLNDIFRELLNKKY